MEKARMLGTREAVAGGTEGKCSPTGETLATTKRESERRWYCPLATQSRSRIRPCRRGQYADD